MIKFYLWTMTWAICVGFMLLTTFNGNHDAAIMLMVLQFAPAIYAGMAWDEVHDPERRWDI